MTTHESVSVLTCIAWPMDGKAMFMIDASRTTTNCATARRASAAQRRGSGMVAEEVMVTA
ncbi:MAG TPA: hypothetical protein VGP64_11395 [Polyangia bacterium]